MLAEVTTATISKQEIPTKFEENKSLAYRGSAFAEDMRKRFEAATGTKVISALKASDKPLLEIQAPKSE